MASLLTGAAAVEVALRVASSSMGASFFVADPERGWSLRPRAEGVYAAEGRQYVRINNAGLRDYEHQVAKQPGSLRIAVLGDSYTEAMQVSPDSTFWSILGRQLSTCSP